MQNYKRSEIVFANKFEIVEKKFGYKECILWTEKIDKQNLD